MEQGTLGVKTRVKHEALAFVSSPLILTRLTLDNEPSHVETFVENILSNYPACLARDTDIGGRSESRSEESQYRTESRERNTWERQRLERV